MPKTLSLQEVAEKMADAIREWNRAKLERESWKPVVGQMPPASLLGNAKKANAMLSKALEEYEAFQQSFAVDAPMWRCRACGSENSHQFANCVHCGASGRR